jgi:hypothetical protein
VLSTGPVASIIGVGNVDGGPLGVLLAGTAAATTGVGDVDGGPPRAAADRSGSGHHRSWRRRWRAPLHPWQYEVSSAKKDVCSKMTPKGLAQSSGCLALIPDPTHHYITWAIQRSSSRGGEQGVGQRCPPSGPPAANPKASGERSTHA